METAGFNLFAYSSLRAGHSDVGMLEACTEVGGGVVSGTVYQVDDMRVLMLYGSTPVHGTVWRCPTEMLAVLDDFEAINDGLLRRVATDVLLDEGGVAPCWLYVAGPRIAPRLTPDARISR